MPAVQRMPFPASGHGFAAIAALRWPLRALFAKGISAASLSLLAAAAFVRALRMPANRVLLLILCGRPDVAGLRGLFLTSILNSGAAREGAYVMLSLHGSPFLSSALLVMRRSRRIWSAALMALPAVLCNPEPTLDTMRDCWPSGTGFTPAGNGADFRHHGCGFAAPQGTGK